MFQSQRHRLGSGHRVVCTSRLGCQTAKKLPRTTFHYADVTNYGTLSDAFQKTFEAKRRLDFVFANAGMIERDNFYKLLPSGGETVCPPPEPDLLSVDVDLKGVILTTYLAQHYFWTSPNHGKGTSLVMTSSCGGLYPSLYSPLYSSAKFGVVGLMRSIALHFNTNCVRVNAICPGIVRTNLVDPNGWDSFPQNRFTEMASVVRVVLQLLGEADPAGQGLTDALGAHLSVDNLFGQAVEISDTGVYFREQHEFCDDGMRKVMNATVLENQVGAILTT